METEPPLMTLHGKIAGIDGLVRNAMVVAEGETALRLIGVQELAVDALAIIEHLRAAASDGARQKTALDVGSGIVYVVMGLRHGGVDLALPSNPTKQVRWVRDSLFTQSFRMQPAAASDDGARQPQSEQLNAEIAKTLRAYLWLGHGHQGQYGDDGEMQCGACAPIWDYRRAPLADVIQQAATARQEVNMAALFKQVDISAAASDDGAARPQPAQETRDNMRVIHSSEIADDPAAFEGDYVPLADVEAAIAHKLAALSSPSVAQGWTALDGFTLDRIEQTLKTIGAITQDDAHWLIAQVLKIVKPSTPAGAAQTKNETS